MEQIKKQKQLYSSSCPFFKSMNMCSLKKCQTNNKYQKIHLFEQLNLRNKNKQIKNLKLA